MIHIFPASERHTIDLGWLRSQPLYSFGEYQHADRNGFGVMRVCNDDYLAPGRGFGAHPHSDMEIVSIVLNGSIKHEDNLGNSVVTGFGEVQRMSAGSGVIHTEFNASETEEMRLLQLWFMPRERGLAPSYEAKKFNPDKLHNNLLPVVSGESATIGSLEEIATINQDMTIYLSKLASGESLDVKTKQGRKLFLYTIEGRLSVADQLQDSGELFLGTGDTSHIEDISELVLKASEDTFFMLIDLP
ncbi:pirin family protein [Paenibacillus sp. GSMTC-2017]|uniref:pirin family protein n=1 Tax=Paenibacillus sp. GSMTC-2017 TaxID=2794350 RepID=UPI0018D7600B|nr:pirin family protein [Paenibacillus sp. GSMTC-2017]